MAELQLESRREHIEDPSQNETRKIFLVQTTEKCTMPIVFDTGCSYSVTPFKDDFVDKLQAPKSWSMLGIKEQIDVSLLERAGDQAGTVLRQDPHLVGRGNV